MSALFAKGASQLGGVDHCVVVDECVDEIGDDCVSDGEYCFGLLVLVVVVVVVVYGLGL